MCKSTRVIKGKSYSYIYWRATIAIHGRQVFCKYFKSEEDAARAYNGIAPVYHGEHARLNPV